MSKTHEAAWRNYLVSHALLTRALDRDLRESHGMSLVTYDALVNLSEAPARELNMKALAEALVFSASGLTRVVDGLERAGFARRRIDPDNRRSTLVALSDRGHQALTEAWPTHAAGVKRHFAAQATISDARTLAEVFRRVRSDLEPKE